MDLDTLNLAKKFTEQSMSGTGSVAGAPCTIKSITKEGTTNTVTFEWQMRDGTVMTSEMQVEDGEQGPKGAPGQPGPEGYSPTAAMVRDEEQGIVTIVIQDKNGKHTAILKDGKAESFDNANILEKLSANENDDLVYNGRVVKGQEFSNKDVLDRFASDASGNIYFNNKSITFDNGVEFMGYKGIEKSCLRKKERTNIYYAHPYCSGERGTNENNNRLIRRFIPKGVDIGEIKQSKIREIEDWINNYPRSIFGYKSSNMILLNI